MVYKLNFRLFFLILPLLFAAGCTVPDVFPGQDVIRVSPTSQEEGFRDVLITRDIETIPKSPILADQTFLLSFIIENRDEEKEVTDVVVDLFDAPLLRTKGGSKKCNDKPNTCVPSFCATGSECKIRSILPGEQKQVTYELRAPDDKAIAGLQTDTDINLRVTYQFSGSTLFKLVVVNLEEIKARQRAGSPITLDVREVKGSGPVKIDTELKGSQYILSGLSGTLAFTVKGAGDLGKGGVKNSKIDPGKLSIEIPLSALYSSKEVDISRSSKFSCTQDATTAKCTNTQSIDMIRGDSIPLLFSIVSKNIEPYALPFQSYDVQSKIDYTYELRDSAKMTILPVSKIK